LLGLKSEGTQVSHLVEFADDVNPAPQGVHAAAPADGATKPSAHAVHEDWPSLAE
jgi:hypothetical protein